MQAGCRSKGAQVLAAAARALAGYIDTTVQIPTQRMVEEDEEGDMEIFRDVHRAASTGTRFSLKTHRFSSKINGKSWIFVISQAFLGNLGSMRSTPQSYVQACAGLLGAEQGEEVVQGRRGRAARG